MKVGLKDGVLDRAALRKIVLADRARLRDLEAVLHPLVRAEQRRFLARARGRGAWLAVLDIPLLFETGGDRQVDEIMAVSAPTAVQRARILARGTMDTAQAERVIALQLPDRERVRRSGVVVRTGLSRFHALRAIKRWLHARTPSR